MRSSAIRAVSVGVVAAVIYVVISVATGGTLGGSLGMALAVGVVAALITFAVNRLVASRRDREGRAAHTRRAPDRTPERCPI